MPDICDPGSPVSVGSTGTGDVSPRMSKLMNSPVIMETPLAPLSHDAETQEPPPWKIIVLTENLLIGLLLSQVLAFALPEETYDVWAKIVQILTMCCLSVIMVNVGYEFNIDKSRISMYGKDYLVAMTAAGFPWVFVAMWFMFALPNPLCWEEALLAARFAAPTSAGILFSMLEGAGLKRTWLFHKARTLAIFDDLDTILLMIPLKVIIMGFKWEMATVVVLLVVLLALAWIYLHKVQIPCAWPWTIVYALIITAMSEGLYQMTKSIDDVEKIHIEVLLPAFVLGCIIRTPKAERELEEEKEIEHEQQEKKDRSVESTICEKFESAGGTLTKEKLMKILSGLKMKGSLITERMNALPDDAVTLDAYHKVCHLHDEVAKVEHVEDLEELRTEEREQTVATIISFIFMVLVGLTMPSMFGDSSRRRLGGADSTASSTGSSCGGHEDDVMGAAEVTFHLLMVSILMVLGKMFPVVCYRDEASILERFALCMGMCPRGEVGAGIIVISLEMGISGPAVTIAMLGLAINLTLSGFFIGIVKFLLRRVVAADAELLKLQVLAAQGKGDKDMVTKFVVNTVWADQQIHQARVCFQAWRLYASLRRRQDERRKVLRRLFNEHYAQDSIEFQSDVQWLMEEPDKPRRSTSKSISRSSSKQSADLRKCGSPDEFRVTGSTKCTEGEHCGVAVREDIPRPNSKFAWLVAD